MKRLYFTVYRCLVVFMFDGFITTPMPNSSTCFAIEINDSLTITGVPAAIES